MRSEYIDSLKVACIWPGLSIPVREVRTGLCWRGASNNIRLARWKTRKKKIFKLHSSKSATWVSFARQIVGLFNEAETYERHTPPFEPRGGHITYIWGVLVSIRFGSGRESALSLVT